MTRPVVQVDPAVCFGAAQIRRVRVEDVGAWVWAEGSVDRVVADSRDLTRAEVLVACWFLGEYGSPEWRARWGEWARQVGYRLAAQDAAYGGIPDPPGRSDDSGGDQ